MSVVIAFILGAIIGTILAFLTILFVFGGRRDTTGVMNRRLKTTGEGWIKNKEDDNV